MSHKPVALPAMKLRDVLSINMQAQRRARGLSQEALAHEAGVDRAYMSAIERSVNSATLDMVEKIAKVLEVEPWILLKQPRRPRRKRRNPA